jgi:hypothetical protein
MILHRFERQKENTRSFRNTVHVNNKHTKTNHEGETTDIADLSEKCGCTLFSFFVLLRIS